MRNILNTIVGMIFISAIVGIIISPILSTKYMSTEELDSLTQILKPIAIVIAIVTFVGAAYHLGDTIVTSISNKRGKNE